MNWSNRKLSGMWFCSDHWLLDSQKAGRSVFAITGTALDCDMFGLIDAQPVNSKLCAETVEGTP